MIIVPSFCRHKRQKIKFIYVFVSLLLIFTSKLFAEPRVALVIGNGHYGDKVGALSDAINDVELMADRLEMLGFVVEKIVDGNGTTMKRSIRRFGEILKKRDAIGLFYYSGHGMQVNGRNYMIPVDTAIADESDIEDGGVGIDYVLSKMEVAGNSINILILDACRDNPFEKRFKSTTKGLNRMDAPKGTLIAFAAEPYKTALQGPGEYSYFTRSLAQHIMKQGVSAIEILREVRKSVVEDTKGQQFPVVEDRLLSPFYFSTVNNLDEETVFQPKASQSNDSPKVRLDSDHYSVGRYLDENDCLRNSDGSYVPGFSNDCK